MTDLIGRTEELAAIERWLTGGGRLLTISGPPGVGKSRLAHEIATRHPGSVICDLTSCRSPAEVTRSLEGALGSSRARLARVLGAFEGLIVLDRFEHLVESSRGLVEGWRSRPGPRFLITSREPLGLVGESTIVLGPLSEANALALYGARAKRKIDERVASSIVQKVDRLPLAIELAAARASVLSDGDVLARLQQGISSLRATIRWSIELLTEDERETLVQCAVFRGPFDGRAAEAIVKIDSDVIASLVALERKSLLRRTNSRVALYDAVREVGLEELERSGVAREVAARHADYFRDRALPSEVADLTAAHAFMQDREPVAAAKIAIAIDVALGGQAPSSAHIELLSSAVLCAERAKDDVLTARALVARARAHRLLGSARRALRDLRAALALARRAESPVVEGDVLRVLGVVARQLSQPLRARTLSTRALEIYEELELKNGSAMVLDDLGVVAHDLGELAAARASYERALSLERVVGDGRFEGITLGHLGLIAYELGELEEALRFHREALDRHRENGDRRFEGFAHAFIAAAMLERGELGEAQRSIDAAATIDARLGDVDSGALLAGIACAIAAASGRIAFARETLERARLELSGRDDDALRRMLDVFALSLDVAEARRARAEGRVGEGEAYLDVARKALGSGARPRCVEERLAWRVVGRLLDLEMRARASTVVGSDGTWFESGSQRVSLATRRSLARMLAKLASERRVSPDRIVGLSALFEAGWPGERVPEASARRRVYVGIDTLRSLGLRAAILQRDGGYFLDPSVDVEEGI